jgi:hypothetical protein
MNSMLLKKAVVCSTVLGIAFSASAGPTPTGSSPTDGFPVPAGLNPSSGPYYPFPSGSVGVPVTVGTELFASGGPVYVTQLGPTSASYDEQLFVASPNDGFNNLFLDNHTTPNGDTFYLGTFAKGTEIEFGLDVLTTGNIWYDGPGARNADGAVHAYVVNNYQGLPNTDYVGFEDEPYDPTGAQTPWDPTGFNGDFNYLDEIYAFTGTTAGVPDTTGTVLLLGVAFTGLAAFGRRFRK